MTALQRSQHEFYSALYNPEEPREINEAELRDDEPIIYSTCHGPPH